MRYRALTAGEDMQFGRGGANFLVDTPETVAQAIMTRLRLMAGEWFLDVTEGTPYATQILGTNTKPTYDAAIRERIIDTQGVLSLDEYSSDLAGRRLSVSATVTTIYGQAAVSGVL